jgi:uncharacterized membrane protein YphA (DoxX/SURF4 family)
MPDLHRRWDLRFTDIKYLPRPDMTQPQRFLYATRIGFGLWIQGEGETIGTRTDPHEQRTSALKFWSNDSKSLIHEGKGYWKYTPTENGIRFVTGYDYRVRFGRVGRIFDALIFRPLLGWATAWSFDRLRLWLEKSIDPAISLQRSLIYGLARLTVAFVWLYHGLIPKLIYPQPDELAILHGAGIPSSFAPMALTLVGLGEVAFGIMVVLAWWQRWPLIVSIALMFLATVSVALSSPGLLVAAFNPVSLNVLLVAVSLVGLLSGVDLPSARHCQRVKREADS